MKSDYYGNNLKTFVGVVKDITDPLGSNRVRVRIKGIHPEDPSGDGGYSGDGIQQFGSNGTTPDSAGGTTSTQLSPLAQVKVDPANLPSTTQLQGKISQHFTLADLTTGPKCSKDVKYYLGQLTPEIVQNLANLATNVLDPLKEQFGSLQINSGWRPHGRPGSNTSNHGNGWAVDIAVPGVSFDALFDWCKNNLKGRFNFLYNEHNHVHIQLGGTSSQGSVTNPVIRVK